MCIGSLLQLTETGQCVFDILSALCVAGEVLHPENSCRLSVSQTAQTEPAGFCCLSKCSWMHHQWDIYFSLTWWWTSSHEVTAHRGGKFTPSKLHICRFFTEWSQLQISASCYSSLQEKPDFTFLCLMFHSNRLFITKTLKLGKLLWRLKKKWIKSKSRKYYFN